MKIQTIILCLITYSGACYSSLDRPLSSGTYYITNEAFIKKGMFLTVKGEKLTMEKLTRESFLSKRWKVVRNDKNATYTIAISLVSKENAITGGKSSLAVRKKTRSPDQAWYVKSVGPGIPIYRIHNTRLAKDQVLDTHESGSLKYQNNKKRTPGTFWRFVADDDVTWPVSKPSDFDTIDFKPNCDKPHVGGGLGLSKRLSTCP